MKKRIAPPIHVRIKKFADAAIARGDVISCDRQPDNTYIITLASDMIPITHTAVGAGTLLYLLNSASASET